MTRPLLVNRVNVISNVNSAAPIPIRMCVRNPAFF
jgi:hypothetical protein